MKAIITETQLKNFVKKLVTEGKKNKRETYFRTFSAAVQYAREYVENKGFEVDEEDWWNEISTGQGKPKEGQTTRASIGLLKDGRPIRKTLNIQVYNMGLEFENNYELNFYVW